MEDANIILDEFGENKNFTYCAAFDGYDGEVASSRAALQLHLAILFSLSKLKPEIKFQSDRYIYDEINHLEKYSNTEVAEFESEILVADDLTEEEIDQKKIYKSFSYAYKQMDKLLSRGKDETSKVRWSGATACACIIEYKPNGQERWIHISNCGSYNFELKSHNKWKIYKIYC